MTSYLTALGLMSGTSLDGVDAALVETDGETVRATGQALTVPYPDDLRARLRAVLGADGAEREAEIGEVERDITLFHAEAVATLLGVAGLPSSAVDVIGFHGHTILHRPKERRTRQIGDGALLARSTGIRVVNDFRTADVAAGGQGAPLVPVYHGALARGFERPLAVLNIGGVANITFIDEDGSLLAFDTGPGNALIDDWALKHTGRPVDEGGALAGSGRAGEAALAAFAAHDFFAAKPPKSLDRDDFRSFATGLVEGMDAADGAATLTAFTAQAVALAQVHLPRPPRRWLVCGGGRRNPRIMAALADILPVPVEAVESVGWDGDALEAQAFAYLAVRSLRGLPLTWPGTTGGPKPMPGGRVHDLPVLAESR
ncbi:anhydro-N-acetylmuramic acid kinase [Telmatospirillum sp. J64-1]|uniref:anhydro-N-acetylmuramic acid kinase n=1 Tax=Telmatospirillum sp. J64-1 TaxID=2502183 RepID=UPI0021053006|nr:anhydro-N-acetylmuramic acid kinase [Telmatospirillum sp. J64-1]